VVALAYEWQGNRLVTLHNLADRESQVRLDLGEGGGRLTPLLGDDGDRTRRDPAGPIRLAGYGYRWFRVDGERR
jgi:maltose alpha-D-glucosyltransferase/alpha-amylase